MTHEMMDRDSDLRARMRSPSRTTQYHSSHRADYSTGERRRPGQDIITSKPALAISTSIAKSPNHPSVSAPVMREWQAPKQSKPLLASAHAYTPLDIPSRFTPKQPPTRKVGLTFGQPHKTATSASSTQSVKSRLLSRTHILIAMAVVVFVVGLAVACNGWLTNKHLAAQASHSSAVAEATGTDNASSAPSTAKPSDNAVSSYAVAPNLPKYITIDNLSVHARVMPMSVNAKNQLRAPSNVYDAGWYSASSQPGQPGAMLVDGHISSWQTHGVFYGINTLKPDDVIKITRGDGVIFSYAVRQVTAVPADKVDMSSLLVSIDPAKPGLNLISCYGEVIPGTNEFDKRVVVQAVLQ